MASWPGSCLGTLLVGGVREQQLTLGAQEGSGDSRSIPGTRAALEPSMYWLIRYPSRLGWRGHRGNSVHGQMDHANTFSQEQRGSHISCLTAPGPSVPALTAHLECRGAQGFAASSTSGGRERLLPSSGDREPSDDSHPEGCQRTFPELSPGEWRPVIISKKDNDSLSHSATTFISPVGHQEA